MVHSHYRERGGVRISPPSIEKGGGGENKPP